MSGVRPAAAEDFARALAAVEQALDWRELGSVYCEGESEGFFDEARVEAVRDAGLRFAADLLERLPEAGESLYAGAGVAELVPVLAESVVARRRVRVHTRAQREAELLNAALVRAEADAGLALPRWSTDAVDRELRHDHLWLVSVLTDPDHFPAHHDELYGRGHPARKRLARERERIDVLLDAVLAGLRAPGLLATTAEELPLVERAADRRGLALRVPGVGRLSGLVGDAVYLCPVRAR